MGERITVAEPLTKRPLTDTELLEMFSLEADGIPFDIEPTSKFPEGLRVAAKIFTPLGVFVGEPSMDPLSDRFGSAFVNSPLQRLYDGKWGMVPNYIFDSRSWMKKRMEERFLTSKGKIVFREAAEAAKKVWSERAI